MNQVRLLAVSAILWIFCTNAGVRAQDFDETVQSTSRDIEGKLSGCQFCRDTTLKAEVALEDGGCSLIPWRVETLRWTIETAMPYAWWSVAEAQWPSSLNPGCKAQILYVRVSPDDLPSLKRAVMGLPFVKYGADLSDHQYTAALVQSVVQRKLLLLTEYGRVAHVMTGSDPDIHAESLLHKTWQCGEPRYESDMGGSYEYIFRSQFRIEDGAQWVGSSSAGDWTQLYYISGKRIYFFSIKAQGIYHSYGVNWKELTRVSDDHIDGMYRLSCDASR